MRDQGIGSGFWVDQNRGRFGVLRLGGVMRNWCVVDSDGRILPKGNYIARFDTHAEAIQYAQEQAKTQALKEPTC